MLASHIEILQFVSLLLLLLA